LVCRYLSVQISVASLSMLTLLLSFSLSNTAPSVLYTLSLHDALPILAHSAHRTEHPVALRCDGHRYGIRYGDRHCSRRWSWRSADRKSTRLNSSHVKISYAVFCLKKKSQNKYRSRSVKIFPLPCFSGT